MEVGNAEDGGSTAIRTVDSDTDNLLFSLLFFRVKNYSFIYLGLLIISLGKSHKKTAKQVFPQLYT